MKHLYDKCKKFFESIDDPFEYITDYVHRLYDDPRLQAFYKLTDERNLQERAIFEIEQGLEKTYISASIRESLEIRLRLANKRLDSVNAEMKKLLENKQVRNLYNSFAYDLNRFISVYFWYLKYGEENQRSLNYYEYMKSDYYVPAISFRENLPDVMQQKYREMEYSHDMWYSSSRGMASNIGEIKEKILNEMKIEKQNFKFGTFLFPAKIRELTAKKVASKLAA